MADRIIAVTGWDLLAVAGITNSETFDEYVLKSHPDDDAYAMVQTLYTTHKNPDGTISAPEGYVSSFKNHTVSDETPHGTKNSKIRYGGGYYSPRTYETTACGNRVQSGTRHSEPTKPKLIAVQRGGVILNNFY